VKALVEIFLKPGVLDVQGKAVEASLHGLGWREVSELRVGRCIRFDIAGDDPEAARAAVGQMCERLLANPVIEGYRVEIEP
jgi:phosphoribosylformylglycinamidine synthase PurS subunit